MTYTGTYRARQSASLHRQDAAKAAELEKDRKEIIRDYKAVASDWKTEQSRLNSLQKLNDQIKATNDAATWKAFDAMVQKAVVPFVKSQWDDAIAAGEEAAAAGGNEQEQNRLKALEAKGEETDELINELARKSDSDVYKNNLLGQQTMYRKGYKRGLVKEALSSYGSGRLDYLATSEDILYDKDGNEFKVKNYSQVEGGYEIASRAYRKNWYQQFRGTVSPTFLTSTASPVINQIELKQKSAYYRDQRISDANDRIDGNFLDFETSLLDPNKGVDDVVRSLELLDQSNEVNFTIIGPTSGVSTAKNERFDNALKKIAKAEAHNLPLREKLKAALSKAKFRNHAAGDGSMAELRAELTPNYIDNLFNDAAGVLNKGDAKAKKARIEGVTAQLNEELRAAFDNGTGLSDDQKAAWRLALKEDPYLSDDKNAMLNLLGLMDKEPVSVTEGHRILQEAREGRPGTKKISLAEAEALQIKHGFPSILIEEGVSNGWIIEDQSQLFVDGSVEIQRATLRAETRLNTLFTRGLAAYEMKQSPVLSLKDQKAKELLFNNGISGTGDPNIDTNGGLYNMAAEYYLENKKLGITKDDAMQWAESELIRKFNALQESTYTDNKLYWQTGAGFSNFSLASENAFAKKLNRRTLINQELSNHVQEGGLKRLINVPPPNIRAGDFIIGAGTGNIPADIFQYAAAADTTGQYTAWDFRNRWLEAIQGDESHPLYNALKNEKPTDIPSDSKLLKEKFSGKEFWELSNWKESMKIRNRVLVNGGLPGTAAMNQAILRNEKLTKEIRSPRFEAQTRINMDTVRRTAMFERGTPGPFNPEVDLDNPAIQTLMKQFGLTKEDFL